MSEQRIQTVKIVWKGDDAKQKAVEFTRSIKGTDKAVEDLNKTMGENATVTAQTTLSAKERTAIARKEFTAANRLVTKYNNITSSLRQQSKMYGMTDEAAEIYTAQMRLGANATKAQKDEIARLVTGLQKQRAATGKTTGSMRNMRGQAQNLGWQMQDVAVQMQMGTDSMVIFSQQGSQLASGFGPTGAIVGALIAVGGALAGVALKSEEAAAKQKLLKETVFDTTEFIKKQVEANNALTQSQLRWMKQADDQKIKQYNLQLAKVNARMEFLNKNSVNSEKGLKAQNKEMDKLRTTAESLEQQIWELEDAMAAYGESGYTKPDDIGESDITKAFESEHARLVKQTETLAEEFNRRARIIFAYGQQVVHDKAKYEEAFINLDKWYTAERKKIADKRADEAIKALQKENKRREKVLNSAQKEIGKGSSSDPVLDEMVKHNRLLKTLYAERNALANHDRHNRERINGLLEQETDRHGATLLNAKIAQMNTDAMMISATANMVSSTVDIMSDGVEQVRNQTAEMNAVQKGMFLTTQAISAAMAVINGISLGAKLAEMFPLVAVQMQALGTSIGAANAGAIMGTTFAGMFDAGGTIPNGQAGVVAERYDEMVGGTMVYNNSGSGLNVTGSKDTANMMNGGGLTVIVENTATGVVNTQVQQIDEGKVKVMIAQHFSENIDKGVSSVINKKGSKADKAIRGGYTTQRRY